MTIFTCVFYILAAFIGVVCVVALMRIEALLTELLNSIADLRNSNVAVAGEVKSAIENHTVICKSLLTDVSVKIISPRYDRS
jgi:hypothetical protein